MFSYFDATVKDLIGEEYTDEEMYAMYSQAVIRVESGAHKIYPSASGGENLIVGTNTVIGKDGFIPLLSTGTPKIIPCLGSVIVGKDVVIGSNCSICRGLNIIPTTIGNNVKIGDNVSIGSSVQIGDSVIIHAGCVVGNFVSICANVVLPAGSIISDSEIVGVDDAHI